MKQIASLWAISSLYQDFDDEEYVYCYKVIRHDYQKVEKGNSRFVTGCIEVQSRITQQKSNLIFALIQYTDGDFHCAIKEYSEDIEFNTIKNNLTKTFLLDPITEIIRALDEYFGKEYFTLKDIFIEERRKILQILLKDKLDKFARTYEEMYDEGKSSIYHMQNLGLTIPDEFKISAGYALSRKFNDLIIHSGGFVDPAITQQAMDINYEAKRMGIKLDKAASNKIFAKKINQNLNRLTYGLEIQQAEVVLELFDYIEKLELEVDIAEAQNIYFVKIYSHISEIIEMSQQSKRKNDKKLIEMLLDIGEKLNINTDFYRTKLAKTETK